MQWELALQPLIEWYIFTCNIYSKEAYVCICVYIILYIYRSWNHMSMVLFL